MKIATEDGMALNTNKQTVSAGILVIFIGCMKSLLQIHTGEVCVCVCFIFSWLAHLVCEGEKTGHQIF